MQAAKHTPGPWVTADGYGAIEGGTAVKAAADQYLIASCTGYYGREGAQANARLIAAAPILLASLDPETLEAIADEIDCREHSSRANSLRIVARNQRAAIAAATGEAA